MHLRRYYSFTISSTLIALAALPTLRAAEPAPEIIVTAQRAPEPLPQTTATVTVIDAEDMRAQGHPTQVFELLRHTEGIDAQSLYGGIDGGAARISLRGLPGSDTQVLLDGVPLNDPTAIASDANISVLTPAGVDRIEVVKGAQSGLYGSRAVGGVVNLISAAPSATAETSVLVEGGSYGSARIDARSTGPLGVLGGQRLGYSVGVAALHSDGFSSQTDADALGDPGQHEADSLDRLGLHARLTSTLPGNGQAYLSGNGVLTNQQYDGFAAPDDASAALQHRLWRIGSGASTHLSERLQVAADVAHTATTRGGQSDDEGAYSYRGREEYGSGRVTVDLFTPKRRAVAGSASLTAGLDRLNSRGNFDSFGDQYAATSRLTGGWLQTLVDGERATFSAVVRHDRHDRYGDATTWRLGAAVFPVAAVKLHAAVGTAFRAPSLFELYAPFYGNADLRPQRSTTYEAGHVSRLSGDFTLANTLFRTDYRTRIGFDPDTFQSINVDGPRIQGIENRLDWRADAPGVRAQVSYTWLRDDRGGAALSLVPQQSLHLLPSYHWRTAWLGAALDWYGHRHATPSDLGGYAVLGAVAGWTPRDWAEVYVRAENLLDRAYVVNPGYSTAGRSAAVGGIVQF